MASIKFGSNIVDARGIVGGTIYSRNGNGAYMKGFTMPVNPNTPAQSTRRAVFGALTQEWRELSQAQQEMWNDAAPLQPYKNRLGETATYSGQQLFNKINASRYAYLTMLGSPLTVLTTPPALPSFPLFFLTALEAGQTAGELTSLNASVRGSILVASDFNVIWYASPAVSGGVSRPKSVVFRTFLAQQAETTTVDLSGDWITAFGAEVTAGQRIFVRAEVYHKPSGVRLDAGVVFATIV